MCDALADTVIEPFSLVVVALDEFTWRQPVECRAKESLGRFDVVAVLLAVLLACFPAPRVLLVWMVAIEIQPPHIASLMSLELDACMEMMCAVFVRLACDEEVGDVCLRCQEVTKLLGRQLTAWIGEEETLSIEE